MRVLGLVRDILMLDSLRHTYGTRGDRHPAIDALKTALDN